MTYAAYKLVDLAYMVARELGVITEGTVTSTGTTTTTADTTDLRNRFIDDSFNGGTLWILYYPFNDLGEGIVANAPEGEWARVTGFVESTGVLTHTAFTSPALQTSRYALSNNEYTRDTIVSCINAALREIPVEYHDDTTITTAESKTEYTLPIEILDQNIEVWINTNDTTNDNYWRQMFDWYIEEDTTKSAKKLIFRTQPPAPYHIRIKYWLPHVSLNTYTAFLRESVDVNRVVYNATLRCLMWKKAQKAQEDPYLDQRIADMAARAEAMKWRNPVRRDYIKLGTYGNVDNLETI